MSLPFEEILVDLSAHDCEECGGGLVHTGAVGSVDQQGVEHFWHVECAPAPVRRVLLWHMSKEKAWLN